MKQGLSKIRNPVLARIFRELGLIEQWAAVSGVSSKKPKNWVCPSWRFWKS